VMWDLWSAERETEIEKRAAHTVDNVRVTGTVCIEAGVRRTCVLQKVRIEPLTTRWRGRALRGIGEWSLWVISDVGSIRREQCTCGGRLLERTE